MSEQFTEPAYVELVFRVHADGTQERFARQVDRLADGQLVDAAGRPGGPLAERALPAALNAGLRRRLSIDERRRRPRR